MYDEEFTQWAQREHRNALGEVQRLESLMEDVSWYQFEISARGWRAPWHTSFPGSVVELYSQVYIDLGFREIGTFPVYYYGPVETAPPVPPMIVYTELELAREVCRATKEQLRNAYEWAPGGSKCEFHSETSDGAKAYRLLSEQLPVYDTGAGPSSSDGTGLQRRPELGGPIEAGPEATASDVLGGVCRD
jgi:hypothetical protein